VPERVERGWANSIESRVGLLTLRELVAAQLSDESIDLGLVRGAVDSLSWLAEDFRFCKKLDKQNKP
jgi:hypothetical protein